ncbi:tRNA epoxyqueuosine(34) reductase QueG [Nitratireductor luteus]|uniref:tRNA epoxyqueuosine(34) reductase QueG n=1 Tax=Nitratireductor luteus TaxID=2976980 RepID=UPI00223FA7CD|nr:tRNA epoxyqueuosine(34) reductase QueG [Nitratireductor luteus]
MTALATTRRLRAFVEEKAHAAGFDKVAVTTPDAVPEAPARLRHFIEEGRHGSMAWMAETAERRERPQNLWPQVRSIIMLGMNYGPDENPLALLERKDRAIISVYARNRDYHDVIKGRLKQLAGQLAARAGEDVKVFVDTAPVMEKPLAAAAGLGWQGKHTNLVSRELGSWLFLGSIFTTAELEPDLPEEDHCGSCRACLDVCPTDAFPAPYQLDARRCISYLTIEHKGPIPHEFREAMANRIYGCDDCLAVCPWNKFARDAAEIKLKARDDLKEPALETLLELDDAAFREMFSGSPIKRIGRDRFIRNVLIAAGNSGQDSMVPACHKLSADTSPLVRGAAVWALSRLLDGKEFSRLAEMAQADEMDEDVRQEWHLAPGRTP